MVARESSVPLRGLAAEVGVGSVDRRIARCSRCIEKGVRDQAGLSVADAVTLVLRRAHCGSRAGFDLGDACAGVLVGSDAIPSVSCIGGMSKNSTGW